MAYSHDGVTHMSASRLTPSKVINAHFCGHRSFRHLVLVGILIRSALHTNDYINFTLRMALFNAA